MPEFFKHGASHFTWHMELRLIALLGSAENGHDLSEIDLLQREFYQKGDDCP